jgi:2,4-dienoyl-CoA reductase-like NADH-dependent reductase (Old Yellow Enzyme family)
MDAEALAWKQNRELLSPFSLSSKLVLKNRIVMAPMTRCFADDELTPSEQAVAYYAARADAGLIISEATMISPLAQGYPRTPGIYSRKQITGWRKITQAVHEHGGLMFSQLWHTGRLAHSHYTGQQPGIFGASKNSCTPKNRAHGTKIK